MCGSRSPADFDETVGVATGRERAGRQIDETAPRAAYAGVDTFDAHAPGPTAVARASDGEIAAEVDEHRSAGDLRRQLRGLIHRVFLADAAEIDLHARAAA